MLFSFTLKAAGLKGIISAVKTSYEEAIFRINQDGIMFYEKHPGSPTLTTMMWKKENIQEFNYTGEKKIVGFRTDDFDKILKRCKADDYITLSYDENNAFLSVKVRNKSWDLRTISSDVLDELKEPKIPHVASCVQSVSEFKEILADIGVFSNNIHFMVDNNGTLHFETAEAEGKSKSQFIENKITTTEDMIDVQYSLNYINDIMRAVTGIFDNVKIHFGNKIPLLLEFELEGFGVLKYYLGCLQVQ